MFSVGTQFTIPVKGGGDYTYTIVSIDKDTVKVVWNTDKTISNLYSLKEVNNLFKFGVWKKVQ